MAAQSRPTTKLLALAAMLVVAGVLCLRAYALFSAPPKAEPVGSPQEQRLSALIEPLVGPDRVRVSIQNDAAGQSVWLILIDGPQVPSGMRSGYKPAIENLARARGFDATNDRLDVIQRPFATAATGALSALEIAELSGLGLAFLLLFGLSLQRPNVPEISRQEMRPDPIATPQPDLAPAPLNDNAIRRAAALANAAPERSAQTIRRWLQEDPS